MKPFESTLIQKAAADCGYERTPELADSALVLRSVSFPESVRVSVIENSQFELRSDWLLRDEASGFYEGRAKAKGLEGLYAALQRFAVLARTRPERLVDAFAEATASMPRTTEAQRLVVERVGQSLFRTALLDYWGRRCCVSGLDVPELLRASHIKPWSMCASDKERLSVNNGLLLAPHFDALFDGGWMTVDDDGSVRLSKRLSEDAQARLGLSRELEVCGLTIAHRAFLAFHRSMVFRV
ncbi:MAG: HNH endonuclease [Burkholderiaceae bacterium]|jgi:hypothetical protein|nr:HNH endonuclease [Burkholderiaceae bacterium]